MTTTLSLPQTIDGLNCRQWETFQPYFDELNNRPLSSDNARQWLEDWSHLMKLFMEAGSVIYVEKSQDTADEEKEQAFLDFVNNVIPPAQIAEQALKKRLLSLDIQEDDMRLVLRNMRSDFELFREENVPLFTQLSKLSNDYDKITGGMTVEWKGEEKNLSQLTPYLQDQDRETRKQAWQLWSQRWLQDRDKLNNLYGEMLKLRQQVAENAGMSDYRAYIFKSYKRFAYTPEDCLIFHQAIEEVVVPAVQRLMASKQKEADYDNLKPWDWIPESSIVFDPSPQPPLKPYQGQNELIQKSINIFQKVDPTLGKYFSIMADDDLLDLETRAGKSLGGYCTTFPLRERPFIFMNGVGIHDNVQTLLHEAGHAFHAFESLKLPLYWQTDAPMEFSEVASMAMELLAAPYLEQEYGGFYTKADANRARLEHLEKTILFFPYMAIVDAFQHWVYTHPNEAISADNCDQQWQALWQRFLPGVNWTGHEDVQMTGWHRKPHIFGYPFYYIEYGMAQVGALQVWRNSLTNPAQALSAYRQALAKGALITLPELFEMAGAEFRFDTDMLDGLVTLMEETIEQLRNDPE